jgi:hypothetical protein
VFGLLNFAEVADSEPVMQLVTSGTRGLTSSGFTLWSHLYTVLGDPVLRAAESGSDDPASDDVGLVS